MTDIDKLIAELEERQEAVDRIAQSCGATAERIFSQAASSLRSQAEKIRILDSALDTLNIDNAELRADNAACEEAKGRDYCDLITQILSSDIRDELIQVLKQEFDSGRSTIGSLRAALKVKA